MITGQNDSDHLSGELGRSFRAAVGLVGRLIPGSGSPSRTDEPSGTSRDGRGSGRDGRNAPSAEQLVPPGERILQLVDENGGRMEQREIVDAVEWSESTVSRKLGKLESAGSISRYRIGRGKLVFLPGAEPDCVGSPFGPEEEEPKLAA